MSGVSGVLPDVVLRQVRRVGPHGGTDTEEAKKKGYTLQVKGTHPSHTLSDYGGEYQNAAYGVANVSFENGALSFSFHGEGGHYRV